MSAEELANTVPAGYTWTVDTPSAPRSGNAQRFRRFRRTLITRARLDFWPAAEDGYKAVTRLTVSAMNLRPPVAAGEPVPPRHQRAPPASCARWPALTMVHWYLVLFCPFSYCGIQRLSVGRCRARLKSGPTLSPMAGDAAWGG